MRPAARLLLVEADALRPILESAESSAFDRATVCTGWSVRDVLAHCSAALTRTARGTTHGFTPEDNQRDVDERKDWPMADVLDELFDGYRVAAAAIDAAGGALDGVGLGEWVHGGDVRDALGVGIPYGSEGSDVAVELLLERSRILGRPPISVTIDTGRYHFGAAGTPIGRAATDGATFVRLCGGRRPDVSRYELVGCTEADFVLFG